MKLATVIGPDGTPQIGALIAGDSAIALLQKGAIALEGKPSPHFNSMLALLRGGPEAMYSALMVQDFVASQKPDDSIIPVRLASFLAPLPVPESLRDAMAFEDHIINATRTAGLGPLGRLDEKLEKLLGRRTTLAYALNRGWYQRPLYYKGNRFSVVGHGAEVQMPAYSRKFDYELEWGVIIGKAGRDIPQKKARDHIAGYTLFNDFSARDVQLAEMKGRLGPAKSKDFDTGNAIGPWLVTPEEIRDPYKITMTASVNGEEWSRGTTADMHWTFEQIISYISRSETLHPGEFIGSGTCSGRMGRGCGLELNRFLRPGDTVELSAEHIGSLRNTVVSAR
ncbi:MAG: fumarylacetoacetate hydrolase family protein [Methyloligellaceae bacterium]